MGDNLLECYNPLYDVHLRQYFALPHMQKHLRNLGLLDGNQSADNANELHAGHLQMMDLMLRNRERVLTQLMDLQRKLDAAEKVELYRRIRSGITNAEELNRSHLSRSLSRPARSAAKSGRETGEGRKRRQSLSPEAGEMIKRVETDYRSDSAPFKNPKSIYNRLAANVYKYQYLHKLDDRTLHKYMNSLRKQLAKLERFREVSFGPHTMARHQPNQLQQSWFFRRRSLPSLEAANHPPTTQAQSQANAGRRSIKSGLSRKSRSGKSQSPHRANTFEGGPPTKLQRTSISRTRGTHRLPPLPQSAPNKKLERTFVSPTQQNGKGGNANARLPPTAVIRPTRKVQEQPPQRTVPISSAGAKIPAGKKTQQENRPASQKGSTTPVPVQKPPAASTGSGILPAIGTALTGAAVGAGITAAAIGGEEENNRESGAPSPSISLAASQTTTTDGGQPGAESEWEQNGGDGEEEEEVNGGTETRPTPEPFLEQKMAEGGQEILIDEQEEGEAEGQHTARPSIHSQIQSPEEEQPPEEPEPPKMYYDEEEVKNEEMNVGHEEEETNVEEGERNENVANIESAPFAAEENPDEEQPEEPIARIHSGEEEMAPTKVGEEETTYPAANETIENETLETVNNMKEEGIEQKPIVDEEEHPQHVEEHENDFGETQEEEVEPSTGRSKREVAFAEVEEEMPKQMNNESSLNYYGKEEWSPRNEGEEEEQFMGEANSPIAASLDAVESERIRQFSHPNLEQETGPEESVRSLASSSFGGSMQREEENWPKSAEENNDHQFEGEEQSNHEQPSNIGGEMEVNDGHELENESTNLIKDKEENEEPIHQQENEEPIHQQENEEPIHQQENDEPIHQQENEEPIHQQENEEPIHRQENEEPIHRQENEEPIQENEEVKHFEEIEHVQNIENEEDVNEGQHVQTPVQLEITPSPENRNWDEEGEEEYGRDKVEETEIMPESVVDDEKDINGNEMVGMEEEEGRIEGGEEAESDAPQLSPEAHGEIEHSGNEDNLDQENEPKEIGIENGHEMSEFELKDENLIEEAQQYDIGKETEGFNGGNEVALEQESERKEFQSSEHFGGGQEEEMPKIDEASLNEEFERIKREDQLGPIDKVQQQSVDLVESESVNADEDGAGRKLSGTDAQLGVDDGGGIEEAENVEFGGIEIGHSAGEGLAENAPLMDESIGAEENVERGSIGENAGHEFVEDPTPREEFVKPNEEENVIVSEDLTGQNIERGNVEEMENNNTKSEVEEHIEKELEHRDDDEVQQGNESVAPIDVSSAENAEIISRPATGESAPQHQRNSLLPTQPSIEITPASEYGDTVEENGEMNSIQFSQPNSPQPKGIENGEDTMEGEVAEHERETNKQNEINLIEFDSSFPNAQEEFGKTDEMKETGHHGNGGENEEHRQQNGHKNEEDVEEENERTPLIVGEGGGKGGMEEHGHGNGHLLSGEGRRGSSAASSAETEGADEEEGSEGSVVIHSETGGGEFGHQQNFQSVKLEDEDLIGKENV